MNLRFLIIVGIVLLVDIYFFQAVTTLLRNSSPARKNLVTGIYWSLSALAVFLVLFNFVVPFRDWYAPIRVYVFAFLVLLAICKLVGSVFLLVDDVLRLFRWIASYLIPTKSTAGLENPHSITRLKFLSQAAIILAAVPFVSLIYGMIKGGFDIRVKKVKLVLDKLPDAFNDLKIVQISDIHCGSFTSTAHFENAARIIAEQRPDLLFFTGDLVNDVSFETDAFVETFSKFKAPMGVFSTLGNHDYGDYTSWESPEAKAENLQRLKNRHQEFGWKLLLNEHCSIEKEGEKIALIGIENWGARGFTKYGNLKKAHAGTENYPVKLLLSHDPSHWEAQVLKDYPDIDVAFAGHTHGMQFGVEIPGFKWSPVQYFYKQWAGLYREGKQYLYVNRGLGFIGYPGRVGILPEITVFELSNKA